MLVVSTDGFELGRQGALHMVAFDIAAADPRRSVLQLLTTVIPLATPPLTRANLRAPGPTARRRPSPSPISHS